MPLPIAFEIESLHNETPGRDAVYYGFIVACPIGYQACTLFGARRDTKLKAGKKSDTGVSLQTARTFLRTLLDQKRRDGYEDSRGPVRSMHIGQITTNYDVLWNEDNVRRFTDGHPETQPIETPADRARAEAERARQAAAEAERERERSAALAADIQTVLQHRHDVIPIAEGMDVFKFERFTNESGTVKHSWVDFSNGVRSTSIESDTLRSLAEYLDDTVLSAHFAIVGNRIIALTPLGRKRPSFVFDGADVFTTARKLAILTAMAASSDDARFYVPQMHWLVPFTHDDSRHLINELIASLKVAA